MPGSDRPVGLNPLTTDVRGPLVIDRQGGLVIAGFVLTDENGLTRRATELKAQASLTRNIVYRAFDIESALEGTSLEARILNEKIQILTSPRNIRFAAFEIGEEANQKN